MKTNINRPFLKREDIMNRKNFQEVLMRYKTFKTPFYRSSKFYVGMAIAASVIIVMFFYYSRPNEKPFVNPPLAQVIIPSHEYIVNAQQDTILTYHTGSQISIPAGTFMDKKGNVVTGNVAVHYREFHEAIEFFVSGIPMNYDSGGVQYTFQSAGMMEIEAFHDGEQLFMNPEKNISVSLASAEPEDKFNLYFLDTVAKQWKFKGDTRLMATRLDSSAAALIDTTLDHAQADSLMPQPIYQVVKELRRIEASKPLQPRLASDNRRRFTIEVDSAEFPEIAIYKNLLFEIGEENKNFDTSSYAVLWEDAKLKENSKGKNYTLNLSTKNNSATYIVYPVFKEQDYKAAMVAYKIKYAEYQKNLLAKKQEQDRLQAEAEKQLAEATRKQRALKAMQSEAEKDLQKQNDLLTRQQERAAVVNASITRSFLINSFGTWNTDRKVQLISPVILAAEFTDESGKLVNAERVYVIDKFRNMLFTYNLPTVNLQFDPKSESILFAVLADDRIAVYDSEKLKTIDKSQENYTFKMHVLDEKFTTIKALRERLGV